MSAAPAALLAARQSAITNQLKQKLDEGKLTHAFQVKIIDNVEIVYYAKIAGFDSIVVDLEHSSYGLREANQICVVALQSGITPVVRVPANAPEWISKCLDGGAQAVIVPHVNSVAEAKAVVSAARFAPHGERSATVGMPALGYEAVPPRFGNEAVNEQTMVICMIETEAALAVVDDIAAVEGLDMLLIGSADMTQDMGIPSEWDNPRLLEAYTKVASACEKASVNGRQVKLGMAGLGARPDLIEKIARSSPAARWSMATADNGILLAGMKQAAAKWNALSQSIV